MIALTLIGCVLFIWIARAAFMLAIKATTPEPATKRRTEPSWVVEGRQAYFRKHPIRRPSHGHRRHR